MHKCSKCGHMNPDYINVCLECGNELDTFTPRNFDDEDDESSEIYEPTQEELNKLRNYNVDIDEILKAQESHMCLGISVNTVGW